MKRFFRIVVFCVFVVVLANSQTATIKRNVVLRATQRRSVWEIHPVTKIEVKRNGQWVDLNHIANCFRLARQAGRVPSG